MVMPKISGGNASMKSKTTKGRRKIEIKKIEKTNSRCVTFSKRRTGLFKKAAETCVLTGAQMGILVSSPGDRVFSFAHPNVDVILDRYLNNIKKDAATTVANRNPPPPLPILNDFNQHYGEVSRKLEAEKKRQETIQVNSGGLRWYEEPVDGLNLEELERYLCSLEDLRKKVLIRADELMMINKPSAFFGSNVYKTESKNNSINQAVDIHTNSAVDDGGSGFQYSGDGGRFSYIPPVDDDDIHIPTIGEIDDCFDLPYNGNYDDFF